jgi:hypothetical protein
MTPLFFYSLHMGHRNKDFKLEGPKKAEIQSRIIAVDS